MYRQILPITLFTALTFFVVVSNESNLIENIAVTKNRIDVKVNEKFKSDYLRDDFFIEYDEDVDLSSFDYSIVSLPFLMNVISIVWYSGEEYYLDTMNREVYESLERIKRVFELMFPAISWKGKVIPRKLVEYKPNVKSKETVAALFSGGIDSTTTSLAHKHEKQLLITAWGQCGLPLNNEHLWLQLKEKISNFAQQYGHVNTFIKSNYYYFLNLKKLNHLHPSIRKWRTNAIEDIGWAGIAAPLMLSKGITKLYIASTDCWDFPFPSAAHPYIDGNIIFSGLRFLHDQFDKSRLSKISTIVKTCRDYDLKKPQLILHQKNNGTINCGKCKKCIIAILCLLALGEKPYEYGFTRNIDAAIEKSKKLLTAPKTYRSLWQCTDLQNNLKKLLEVPKQLTWLLDIDFSAKNPADKGHLINWSFLHERFPAILKEYPHHPPL